MEKEEWEVEVGRERERREGVEEGQRGWERRCVEAEGRRREAEEGWRREERRATNLEEVLSEFQAGEHTLRRCDVEWSGVLADHGIAGE